MVRQVAKFEFWKATLLKDFLIVTFAHNNVQVVSDMFQV